MKVNTPHNLYFINSSKRISILSIFTLSHIQLMTGMWIDDMNHSHHSGRIMPRNVTRKFESPFVAELPHERLGLTWRNTHSIRVSMRHSMRRLHVLFMLFLFAFVSDYEFMW